MSSFEATRAKATVFQWNAGGLRSRLSDFRQFVHKYLFPVIAISESNVPETFRLSGYEIFQSLRGTRTSRVMLAVRKDLTYVTHSFQSDDSNEYVVATVQRNTCVFTIVAAYIAPRSPFNEKLLDSILQTTPPPHIIAGDFNAHHPMWGGLKTDGRGRSLVNLSLQRNLTVLNNGSPTFFRGR